MKKLYDKSEILFALVWIVAYCLFMSVGDGISAAIGLQKSASLAVAVILSALLLIFLKKNRLYAKYGLCLPKVSAAKMLFYIPVLLMLTANLWHGIKLNLTVIESVLYVLTMLGVGFLEEIIFRGLLFGAMSKTGPKAAVIVSSLTFGIGHIINLFNGSGAELLPNILQVIYASAAGFMFVMMYVRSGSLLYCIAAHGIFNALSLLAPEPGSGTEQIITALLLTLITLSYAIYLALAMRNESQKEKKNDT